MTGLHDAIKSSLKSALKGMLRSEAGRRLSLPEMPPSTPTLSCS